MRSRDQETTLPSRSKFSPNERPTLLPSNPPPSTLTSGTAALWADHAYNQQGALRFQTLTEFSSEFSRAFTLVDCAATATATLEGTSYFQNGRSVQDYVDQFRMLIHQAEYTDQRYMVICFRRGLDQSIGSTIATTMVGQPSGTDLEGWISSALHIEAATASNRAFYEVAHPQSTSDHSAVYSKTSESPF